MASASRVPNAAVNESSGAVGDERRRSNTLFVTRIPFNVTNTDLETFFSDVGPLRRAFIVTDKETHKSKGVGYVTYTDATDAQKALEMLQGASINGSKRQIQLQWADRKTDVKAGIHRRECGPESVTDSVQAPRRAAAVLPDRDPDAVRTIVITGLASCSPAADIKSIYKRVRKVGDVEHVEFAEAKDPVQNAHDTAYVRFRTPNHAMQAVPKLHAHQFKGAQLSVELKKRVDGALRRDLHMRDDTRKKQKSLQDQVEQFSGQVWGSVHGRLERDSRLIVRNLPFDMTVEDLRAVFLPYGALYNITIPTSEENGRGRGFAFVWYVSKSDASKAMAAINGVQLRHGAAEQALLKKAQGKKGREAAKEALASVHKIAQPARPVAVDWSLSQKEWLSQVEHAGGEETDASLKRKHGDAQDSESDAEVADGDGVEDNNDGDDKEVDHVGNEEQVEDDDDEDENEKEDSDIEATAEQPPKLAPPEAGTTLFIRNLPYQATEQELKDLFRSFGPLRYARITMDPATNRSRGTGFLCFWKRSSADALLRDAEIVQQETGATDAHAKTPSSNPFKVPSVLTADPSAPLVSRFMLHGRVLHIVRAVTRETATHLETSARKAREKGDKRNTWLLREGVPFPHSSLSALLTDAETEKRMRAFSIRRAQLGANPSLHVSKTRLAVHQLPLFVNNRMLKRLALHAVRAFNDEVKQGTRADLDEDEKADKTESANATSRQLSAATDAKKKRPPPSVVVQSKVVLQNERVDPLTGQGRSRGYGFLEMRSFPHALKVLRWANGNKELGRLLMQWWREELERMLSELKAGEDSEEMRLRKKRIEQAIADVQGTVKSEARGVLRIEFSIENITTVRKRVLRQEQARSREHASVKRQKVADPLSGLEDMTNEEADGDLAETKASDDESELPTAGSFSSLSAPKLSKSVQRRAANKVASETHKRSLGSLIGKKRAVRKRKHGAK